MIQTLEMVNYCIGLSTSLMGPACEASQRLILGDKAGTHWDGSRLTRSNKLFEWQVFVEARATASH